MLPTNYGRFYQNSDNLAILKQKLKESQIQTGQTLQACSGKLPKPSAFTSPDGKHRTGLKRIGGGIERCTHCGHPWVTASKRGDVTTWHCEKCNSPRLALRPKTDIELIATLLSNPKLKGWDGIFLREMQRRRGELGRKQREKLRGIAQRLGVKTSQTWDIFASEGGEA